MSRLSFIQKDENLYKTLTFAFHQYDKSFGLSKGECRKNIALELGLKEVKQLNNYFHQFSTKYLRIEEFFIILNYLDKQQQKIIFDYVLKKYDFVCSDSASDLNCTSDLKEQFLNITSQNGLLASTLLSAFDDSIIDKFEIEDIKSITYKLRSLLKTFENRLDKLND